MALEFTLGFGKAEVAKAVKGARMAGGGTVLATALSEVCLLPEALMQPPLGPYVVAEAAVAINIIRQGVRDNGGSNRSE